MIAGRERPVSVEGRGRGESASNIAALVAEELAALAADARTLGQRLASGDIVPAVVLASNGLTDLLEIDGLRVAAELPPTLLPGEAITVMVTGFTGDRINLQIIATPTADASRRSRTAEAPPRARASAPAVPPAARAGAKPGPAPAVGGAPRPAAGAAPPAEPRAHTADPSTHPADAARIAQLLPPVLKTIEARLAAAHAMSAPIGPPLQSRPGYKSVPSKGAGPAPPGASAVQRPRIDVRPAPSAAALPAAPPPRTSAAYTDPAALLRALRLPVTATNVASARMALESPENLPNALATLERALANTADPRLMTVSTLTSFLARLEPQSPVLATQVAAFAEHVVIGPEAKLAQLAEVVTPSAERVAVVHAALDYDLKTQLLALGADGASSARPSNSAGSPNGAAFDRAVAGVLSAITALQLSAAATLGPNPDGLAFTLPIALSDGFATAHVRIDRDAPDGHKLPLDGDNFHIAFVLETRHLGTVGIDMMTVGRAVTLSLKTDTAPAGRAFGRALSKLSARLETLRYRVAKASAVIAPAVAGSSEPPNRPPARDAARLVDIDA